MAGKAIILASGKRGVGASGKAMVTDADGNCPECCVETWICSQCWETCCYSDKSEINVDMPALTYAGADGLSIAAESAITGMGAVLTCPAVGLVYTFRHEWWWVAYSDQFTHSGTTYRIAVKIDRICEYYGQYWQFTVYIEENDSGTWVYSSGIAYGSGSDASPSCCAGVVTAANIEGGVLGVDWSISGDATIEVVNNKCCYGGGGSPCSQTDLDACPDGAPECEEPI